MDAGNGALSTAGRRAENRDSKKRSKAIPVSARHGRSRPVTVIMKEILILIIAALGYSQHAKHYCSQQPHSLPPDSLVLKAYPCDAGGAQRALYLLRNIVGVYHDMLRLGPSDRYASFQLVVVFIQLGARLALPARMHRRLATAFLSQLHRVFPLAYLLAVSYQGVPPSAVSQWYLTTQPALDFMANILFPVNPASECLYGTASMLLITAIWYRFAHLGLSTTTTTRLALAGPAAAICDASTADAAASLAGAGTGTAATICGISNVIADTAVAPPSGHGRSPYHLHTWLPFQLLMSAACTVATLLLERWRGSDTAFSLLSSEDDERPHTGRASSQEGLGGYRDATAAYTGGNAASSAAAAASAQGIAPAPPAEAGRGAACTFGRSKHSGGSVDGGGTDVGDTAVGQAVADAARTLPERPHDHRQLTAAPGEVPAAPSNTVGGHLASVAAVVSACGSSWACGIAGHVDESATSGGNRAKVDSTAVFPALNAEAAEDEAGTLGSAAALRLSVSQPLQAAPGSLSGFGPVWRDSELTEGSFMLGLLSSAEPVAYMEDEDASGGAGTGVIGLALHDGAGGSHSGGSSAADVVWQDQRQCAPPAPAGPAGASGGRAEVAGHMFVVSGSVLTARGNPVAAATDAAVVGAAEDNGDDGYLGRTHQRVYRLLRSLSSQASQPGLAQPHMQLPHPQVQNHPQSSTHQLASDHTVLAQPHLQRPSHPAQRLQQPVWPLSAPDGVTTTAVVSAAMQQARRPVYVPRVRIVTTHIKVQGVHPEQVQSGYTQRLEHVASAAGQRLIGAYVRAGCIELVLDSADWTEVKSSEGGETSSEAPLLHQPSERDSGPLPASLQPRPLAGPPYRSAPSTPSRLQRQQQGGLVAQHLLQPLQQQHHGMLPSAPQLSMQEQLQQALAQGSAEHPQASWLQAAQGPAAASSISGASNGSARVDLSPTPGWAQRASTGASTGGAGGGASTGGGMWQSLQVAGASGAGGGSGGGNGGSNSTGADLDLGAVIRALRLHRAEGSAESTNDLASELDMDLEFSDRLELVASGINSGGSGGDGSSKEAPIGSGGRRGVPTDAGLGGAMMNPVALGLTPIGGLSPNTSLLQNLQQHQLQQQLRQQYPLDGAVLSAPAPPPPPSVVSMAGSISRQALVLGGPRDPLAPGIVSLNPRVFFVAPASSAATATASEAAALDMVLHPNQSTSQGQRAALAGRYSAGDPSGGGAPMRFSAVVRLVATTLMPSATTATATMAAVAAPIMQAAAAAVAPAPGADPEFTMRARGEYLPLRAARLSPASVAVAASVSMPRVVPYRDPQRGAAPGGGVVGIGHTGSELGGGGLPQSLVIGAGPREGVEDTSSDIDTGRYGEGARAVAAWMWHQSYVLEVLEAPQSPGLLLVDMRGAGSGMSPPCAVPLVAMSDAAAAVELQSVVERWEGSPSELDDLLLDLGTWLHHTSQPTQAAPGVAVASPAPALGPSLDERLAALGRHLLSYAVVCGWEATAAALRVDLAKHGILPSAYDGSSGSSGVATCGGPAGSSPWIPMPPAAPTGVAQASLPAPEPLGAEMGTPTAPLPVQQQQQHPVAGAGDVGNGHRSLGLLQLGLRLRLARRGVGAHTAVAGPSKVAELPPEAEEREFRVFQQACMSSQIWVMTLLDCVCLAALLFRGRHEPLMAPSNVTTLIACCTGAVTAAARLVLPYQQWLHVAEVTKVPRHACYCLTKLLIGVAGLPAPPGISSYELGLPVFIFEAFIVPWSCLLSIPTAITTSAIKMPVYMTLWHTLAQEALKEAEAPNVNLTPAQIANLRAFLSPTRRLLRALAVASLFVFVTAACHAHIRLAYTRHNRRRAVVAVGPLHRRRCQWLHWL